MGSSDGFNQWSQWGGDSSTCMRWKFTRDILILLQWILLTGVLLFTDILLDSFALGSVEWYCYTHWQNWFKYCTTCFLHLGHQVQCFVLVFQVAEASVWWFMASLSLIYYVASCIARFQYCGPIWVNRNFVSCNFRFHWWMLLFYVTYFPFVMCMFVLDF